jgi:hypothetical protein
VATSMQAVGRSRPSGTDDVGPIDYRARASSAIAPLGSEIAVRVVPHHPDLDDVVSSGCIAWSH